MTHNRLRIGRCLAIALSLALGFAPARAQPPHRAGLVIQHADGRVATYCVRFAEPSITGLDLLNRAGVPIVVEVSGLGTAVCAMDGQGCAYPAQPCFCQCQGVNCAYWNYLHLFDGAWRYSSISVSGYTIADGAVDGWAWGDKVIPPLYTVDQICAGSPTDVPVTTVPTAQSPAAPVPAVTSTATSVPGSTPIAEATDTPQPAAPAPATDLAQPAPATGVPAPAAAAPSDASTAIPSAQEDVESYAVFAIVVVALGGWLIVNSRRKR